MPTPDPQGPELRLDVFVRQRSAQLGLSLTALCQQAGISRQTLYELERLPHKLPSLTTIVALAQVLEVHPMRLLHFVFEMVPVKPAHRRARAGDRSAFIDDVTFPDGSTIGTGQRFEKVWSVQNVGTVPWRGRALQCRDDEIAIYDTIGDRVLVTPGLRPEQRTVALPDAEPGETLQVAVRFTAPGHPCSAISYWKMIDADGRLCFPSAAGLWVQVRVVALAASAFAGKTG